MTDRAEEDPVTPQIKVPHACDPVDRWVAGRMIEACTYLRESRGLAFSIDDEGELHVGGLSMALRSLATDSRGPTYDPQTALMCVLPRRDRHASRHTLALQLNAHALVNHGTALTAIGDGTLVLIRPIELHLYDRIALAAAMAGFADLAQLTVGQLGLESEIWS
ncbi:MAG: hypothetical protein KA795_02565 [Burkholderiaceae bacterium]|nr:hypothetical protein [Burkholderiaceae bacterium]